nr:MAG TPA: hypothetical protein [Herelleviridae sp.]
MLINSKFGASIDALLLREKDHYCRKRKPRPYNSMSGACL